MYGSRLTSKKSLIGRFPALRDVLFSFDHHRMIKTGDWTIPDLIRYLVSVRPTLQSNDIENLRRTPAFSEEATAEQNRNEGGSPKTVPKLKASDLYEPLDVFRNLGLPIIDWRGEDDKHKWRSNSEEGIPDTV